MLNTPIGILNPISLGGGQYQFSIYFQDGVKAKYLRIGDYVKANNGNEYEIISWTSLPDDFISGNNVITTYITVDSTPPADTSYNSLVYTLNQKNYEPELQTSGQIGNISPYSGQNYEYTIGGSWVDNVQALTAAVGDKIVDANGKEFKITYLSGNKFDDPFRVKEVEKIGQSPISGQATLYRSTKDYNFYQGSELTNQARTNIFNRDKILIDEYLALGAELGTWNVEERIITSAEEMSGELTLARTPKISEKVIADIIEGTTQTNGEDFTVSGNTFSWGGLGLGLSDGDCIRIAYFY